MPEASPHLFDTIHAVEIPEGIDLHADLSGPIPRALAYASDLGIRAVILMIGGIISLLIGKAGMGFWLILSFLLEWWYPVFFEMLRQGQTPGKKFFNLVVVNEDLTPVTWSSSIIRNLLRAVDFLPSFYVAGLVSLTATRRFQRLGDLAAGTIVIQKSLQGRATALPDADTQAPSTAFSAAEQDAIIEFTLRHKSLSQARQEELSNILAPVTHKQGREGVEYLRALGNWFMGAR
ncbi:MAG TPA: RDD family protein [Cellvibrio sp.]|nr:RDD family protein [Cellvibrio sp.]